MATPNKKEIDALEAKLRKFLKKLNPDGSPKRPMDDNISKALFRSAVRKKWMYCDTKIAFLLMKRIPDMDNSTRTKWIHRCNKCQGLFKEGDVNVDHIYGEKQFVEWEQAQDYATSILDVCFDDLQILCIECHKTKTRGETLGIDWTTEQGWSTILKEQEYTQIMKSKAQGQKDWLESKGVVPAKTELVRGQQIREVLFSE
mgnify:CR=1 FL=1